MMDGTAMTAIISTIFGSSSFFLGHIFGRKKAQVQIEKLELENLTDVVDFYKNTFKDLKEQLKNVSDKCQALSDEITILRKENANLKKEIHELTEKLKTIQK